MNESILKLAKETFTDIAKTTTRTIMATPDEIEAFYRAAYNKAIEDASRVIAPYKCYDAQIDIHRLEMK